MRHRASSRCRYYSRQTCIPTLRREQLAKLKLRLSHSASLITSKRFKVSSTSKTSKTSLLLLLSSSLCQLLPTATSDATMITVLSRMLLLLIKLIIMIALFIYPCDRIRGSARFIKLAQNQLKSNLIKASCSVCAFARNCFT